MSTLLTHTALEHVRPGGGFVSSAILMKKVNICTLQNVQSKLLHSKGVQYTAPPRRHRGTAETLTFSKLSFYTKLAMYVLYMLYSVQCTICITQL